MQYIILDLEWNAAYSRRRQGFINEIIEFGAVKVDGHLQVVDTFSALVRPQVGKKISGKVRSLTNITNEELVGGTPFMQVMSRFRRWAGQAVVLTWGTSDILTLIENSLYFSGSEKIPFLQRYMDLQAYCQYRMGETGGQQMGLSTAAEKLGIDETAFDHHRALDDSLLSLACLRKVWDPGTVGPFIQNAQQQAFYDRMRFKTTIITDLHHPLIRRRDLMFRCEQCGIIARRLERWQLHNKAFRARFFCRNCEQEFIGRVQFKLKYEGMTVKKKVLPLPPEKEEKKAEKKPEEAPPALSV